MRVQMMEAARLAPPVSAEDEIDTAVFMNMFIPKTLSEVVDFEREGDLLRRGETSQVTGLHLTTLGESFLKQQQRLRGDGVGDHDGDDASDSSDEEIDGELLARIESNEKARATGLWVPSGSAAPRAAAAEAAAGGAGARVGGSADDGSSDSDDSDDSEGDDRAPQFVGSAVSKEERKAHKAEVKAAAREKRKDKVPKHVKKRKDKLRKAKK